VPAAAAAAASEEDDDDDEPHDRVRKTSPSSSEKDGT
jgi:hypothetical protein